MTNYNVCVKIVFKGIVQCRANSIEEAKQTVEKNFSCTIGNCSNNGNENIKDWEISVHNDDIEI